ncbi:MAG: cell division topological specificity factor MinE [Chloroflexi bacterium]|nr:cell division topological specificity factor MinE [Chloroflexota bacterium]
MSWLDKFFGNKEKSGATAKKRLQMVLIHDRSEISPGMLQLIQDDIIQVIAKRLEIDPESVEVKVDQSEREGYLVAEVPLAQTTRRRATAVQ